MGKDCKPGKLSTGGGDRGTVEKIFLWASDRKDVTRKKETGRGVPGVGDFGKEGFVEKKRGPLWEKNVPPGGTTTTGKDNGFRCSDAKGKRGPSRKKGGNCYRKIKLHLRASNPTKMKTEHGK